MTLDEIRKYKNWVGKSPGDILEAVKGVGGWKNVFDAKSFPDGLPRWAHRVRNFFNREPTVLELKVEGSHAYFNLYKWDKNRGAAENMALSGDVYKDEFLTTWFQMSPGGTIYHFKHPKNQKVEAILQGALGQINTPVFKLVSPDGSGGSIETIVDNPFVNSLVSTVVGTVGSFGGGGVIKQMTKMRSSTIGEGGKINITSRIIKNYDYQGSYNYAETVDAGFSAHEKFDIDPHKIDEKGYLNPSDRHSSLFSRKFPEYPNNDKKQPPLAEQIKYS